MSTAGQPEPFWIRRIAELRLSLRITVAGVVSFALAHLLGLPQGYWAVFTAVLVVQASIGGSLKVAIDRLVGTLGGAAYGAIIAILVPHGDAVTLGIALAISLAPLAVLAALSPSFRVAPLTAVVLLLGSAAASEGPILAALLRSGEVALGAVVGIAASVLILPARAHALMGQIAERLTGLIADLTIDLFEQIAGAAERRSPQALHDAIRTTFDKLEAAAGEAHRERRTLLGADVDPDPVPRTLRRIYHDLVLIGRIAAVPLPEEARAQLAEPLTAFAAAAADLLRETGRALAARRRPPSDGAFQDALSATLAAIAAMPDSQRPVTLGFALEQLQRNFADLDRRALEFAGRAPPAPTA
jgi:uncharacterized membrane protein YccC